MSNTPETDEEEWDAENFSGNSNSLVVDSNFARRLERERDHWKREAENAKQDLAQADTDTLRALHERNEARKERDKYKKERDQWAELAIETNDERKLYKEALEQIANTDYRGNRSHESVVAYNALKSSLPRT